MLRILPTAAITVRMLVTAIMMIIKPCSILQHKKLANLKREEIKGRGDHHVKKSGTSIPRSIPEQYSAGKKEGWGNSSLYKLKNSSI